ncbi:hypothetical protein PAMP_006473 [Pampus punctatissimus]
MAEKTKQKAKRVFINNVDSYASKCIAKFLSACVVGAPAASDGEMETEEEEERMTTAFHIVGTVSDTSEEDRPYVLEEYLHLNQDELLPKLMECDIIIYNITQHAEQVEEALWAVTALNNKMGTFTGQKMFILVSTVMTWACSKPVNLDDLELPFTDDDFRRRRAHPNFKEHIDLEKKVVKMGKTDRTLFCTYVVASGLQYGMGEQLFHFFFKMSWLGKENEIPVFGEGNNIVPMIHINDLACVIQNIIEHQPKLYYLLAVDYSNNTMEDIVKKVASVLGPGKIQKKEFEEAYLTEDLTVIEIDSMRINLRMESVHLKELFSIRWVCESGLVENMELVVEEYRQSRGLLPIRVCVLGPPAVGKSTVSKHICRHYKLHHIRVKETISETISKLEDTVRKADAESEGSAAEAQELLSSLRGSMEQNGGTHTHTHTHTHTAISTVTLSPWLIRPGPELLDDQLLVKVMKDKLMSNPCRNQGFVLDGFPKTSEQAKELFYAEDHESEDGTSQMSSYNKKIMPEFVLCLDASDGFLKDRVMNLPERLVQEHGYEQEHFLQRLAGYRESTVEDNTVINYFDELDITPLYLGNHHTGWPSCMFNITKESQESLGAFNVSKEISNNEPDCLLLMQKIFDTVGRPRNYGPSSQEVQQEERRKAEQRMRTEAQDNAEEERRKAEEAGQRAAHWEEWAQSVPMRNYLMEHVMPTLTQGLIQCCTARPQDPVDFLNMQYFTRLMPSVPQFVLGFRLGLILGGGPEEKQRAPRGRCEGRIGPRRAQASGRMDGGIVLTRGKDKEEEEEEKQPHIQQGG